MVEKECDKCTGKGWITQFDSLVKPCKKECPKCGGSGYILQEKANS